ncbi:MAG: hypothetical protein IJO52_00335 [Clostridia bacterium]|nr:hypothetical protein [Clostridia bacterium]
MSESVITKLGGFKGIVIIAVAFVTGLLLVFVPQRENTDNTEKPFDGDLYVAVLEKRLCDIISAVSGTGDVKVMVTLESSPEQYYQRDVRHRSSNSEASETYETEETLVFEERRPIPVKEIYPEIKGIAVVCGGASDSRIAERIISLVSCTMNVSANRIYVTY